MKEIGQNTVQTLSSYLVTNPTFCNTGCTLKLSVISPLKNGLNKTIPYLEYRIRKGASLSSAGSGVTPNIRDCFLNYPPISK